MDLAHSQIRTEHSYIDTVSVNDVIAQNDHNQPILELQQLSQWVRLYLDSRPRTALLPQSSEQMVPPRPQQCYLLKIINLNGLSFRKMQKQSRVHLTMSVSFLHQPTGNTLGKPVKIFRIAQEVNPCLFELRESICLYFYTNCEQALAVRAEVALREEQQLPSNSQEGLTVYLAPQSLGVFIFPLEKEVKNKEKGNLLTIGQENIKSSIGTEQRGCAWYQLIKSDSYKHIQWLIPPNTICDSSDTIPGVMGGSLPLNQHALSDFALTPDATGLLFQLTHLQLNSKLISDVESIFQMSFKHTFSGAKVTQTRKELGLRVLFHNGWKAVSSGETCIKEKENQIVPTQQSVAEGGRGRQRESALGKSKLIAKQSEKTHLEAQKSLELGLIFPDDQQCVLIVQVFAKVTVTAEYDKKSDKKQNVQQSRSETMELPICYSLLPGKSLKLRPFHSLTIIPGSPEGSPLALVDSIFHQMAQLKPRKDDLDNLKIDDGVSIAKTIRTHSNLTVKSVKRRTIQLGLIQFQLQGRQKQVLPQIINASLNLDNLSSFNFSRAQLQKDKIQAEKERILKETRRAIQAKKMAIEFFGRPSYTAQQSAQILVSFQNKDGIQQLKQKKELLRYLSQFVSIPKLPYQTTFPSSSQSDQEMAFDTMAYYKLQLGNSKIQSARCEWNRLPGFAYQLMGNCEESSFEGWPWEKVPIEIVRTELSELNYSNCYFFNFLAISSSNNQSVVKLPRVFFFRSRLWTMPEIRSQLLTVNSDTGQIMLYQHSGSTKSEEISASKVMHVEAGVGEWEADNYHQIFMQMVEYLYNGVLCIQMLDYTTGHSFGWFMLPLRPLLRKRRSEAIFTHQDHIYQKGKMKGKLKLQARVIRKMKPKVQAPGSLNMSKISPSAIQPEAQPQSPKRIQNKEQQQEERIRQKINRFKQKRTRHSRNQFESKLEGQTDTEKERQIQHLIVDKYVAEQKLLKVTHLQKTFVFLSIRNPQDIPAFYRLSVSDPDHSYLSRNALSVGEQLTLVQDFQHLEFRDRQKLLSVKKYAEKTDKLCRIDKDGVISLEAKGKGNLMMCYLSVRKYWEEEAEPDSVTAVVYNRERTVTCSLTNHQTGTVEALYNIHIIPTPDPATLDMEACQPTEEKVLINLPFLQVKWFQQNIDQLWIDDPFSRMVAVHPNSVYVGSERGCFLELNQRLVSQTNRKINLLVINNTQEKSRKTGESRKIDRSRAKIATRQDMDRSRVRLNTKHEISQHSWGPPLLSFALKLWGCQTINLTTDLWVETETSFTLNTRPFVHLLTSNFVYLFSEDSQVIKVNQHSRMKIQTGPQLFKLNRDRPLPLTFRINSNRPGYTSIGLHVVDANAIIRQEEALLKGQFREVFPLYRMVICLQTRLPTFKQTLKINLNRSTQQKLLEQPFSYKSSSLKKTGFRVLSSDGSRLWIKGSDSAFQLEAKTEKKVTLQFDVRRILEQEEWRHGQSVILGVLWDRGADYFGFRFNII